jgi:hypothetical protein
MPWFAMPLPSFPGLQPPGFDRFSYLVPAWPKPESRQIKPNAEEIAILEQVY